MDAYRPKLVQAMFSPWFYTNTIKSRFTEPNHFLAVPLNKDLNLQILDDKVVT